MSAVFQFCIHRVHDDGEAFVAIPDAAPLLREAAVKRFRETPARKRLTNAGVEQAIRDAVDAALDDVVRRMADHTVRM